MKGALKKSPCTYSNKTEYTDDLGAAIARLQMIREDFAEQVARINRTIDDLKRAREMAREMDKE